MNETKNIELESGLATFREMREAKGMTLEQILAQTHFPEKKLIALDDMRFDELGLPAFTIGYIQRYGKVIGFDAEPYVKAYKESRGLLDSGVAIVGSGERFAKTSTAGVNNETNESVDSSAIVGSLLSGLKRISLLHLSLAAIAIWVVVMIVFPVGNDHNLNEAGAENGAIALAASDDAMPSSLSDAVTIDTAGSDNHASLNNVANSEGRNDPADDTGAVSVDEEYSTNLTTENTESNIERSAELLVDATEQDKPDVSVSTSQVEVANSAEVLAGEPTLSTDGENSLSISEDEVVFRLLDECWIKLTDATGKVLFADIKNKGDNLRLFGQSPFEVVLGNARGVDIYLNDEQVMFKPRANRRTLKLTLAP